MQLMPTVLDKHQRLIDLREQQGGLTGAVFETLRVFLQHNDHYVRLQISDNALRSDATAELCALLKRHPHLTHLEAQNCGFVDRDFRFCLGIALMTMPCITYIDLSRNPGLTDASAETVARVLVETEIQTMRLLGTSLTVTGGGIIAAAVHNTTSLMCCELPFTVGNDVLQRVEACTRRNRAHHTVLHEAAMHDGAIGSPKPLSPPLPTVGGATTYGVGGQAPPPFLPRVFPRSPISGALANTGELGGAQRWTPRAERSRKYALTQGNAASRDPASVSTVSTLDGRQSFATSSSSSPIIPAGLALSQSSASFPLVARGTAATTRTLEEVTVWDWTDPAVSTALRCLHVLDRRAVAAATRRHTAVSPRAKGRCRSRAK